AVRPVKIIENEDDGSALRPSEDEAEDGVEQPVPFFVLAEPFGRGDFAEAFADDGRELAQHVGEEAEIVAKLVRVGCVSQVTEDLRVWRQGGGPFAFDAATPGDDGALSRRDRADLFGEAALPDPRFADEESDAAVTFRRPVEAFLESAGFVTSSDERGSVEAFDGRAAVVADLEGRNGFGDALQVVTSGVLELEPATSPKEARDDVRA